MVPAVVDDEFNEILQGLNDCEESLSRCQSAIVRIIDQISSHRSAGEESAYSQTIRGIEERADERKAKNGLV